MNEPIHQRLPAGERSSGGAPRTRRRGGFQSAAPSERHAMRRRSSTPGRHRGRCLMVFKNLYRIVGVMGDVCTDPAGAVQSFGGRRDRPAPSRSGGLVGPARRRGAAPRPPRAAPRTRDHAPEAVRDFLLRRRERLSGLSFREGARQLVRAGLMATARGAANRSARSRASRRRSTTECVGGNLGARRETS